MNADANDVDLCAIWVDYIKSYASAVIKYNLNRMLTIFEEIRILNQLTTRRVEETSMFAKVSHKFRQL